MYNVYQFPSTYYFPYQTKHMMLFVESFCYLNSNWSQKRMLYDICLKHMSIK